MPELFIIAYYMCTGIGITSHAAAAGSHSNRGYSTGLAARGKGLYE